MSAGRDAIEVARHAGLVLDPWQADVMVDALGEDDEGQWAAFEVGLVVSRQNGKGACLEARVLAGLNLFDERLILWSAHETKTAFEAFRRVEELFTNVDDLRRRVKKVSHANGDEGIELRDGSRLRFVARTKGSGRGFSADLVILDEAYALTADQMSALIPTLASRDNPQVWYTSSPPLDGITGDQLFALRDRAAAGDPSLAWFDFGLQGVDLGDLYEVDAAGRPAVDLDDRELWYATNPAAGIRIAEQFIERERRTMSPEDFARERLGIWPRRLLTGSGVIDPAQWQALADPGAPRAADVVFCVEVEPGRTHAAIMVCGMRPDGALQVGVADYRIGIAGVVDRLVELRDRWNPLGFVLDIKSHAAPLLLDLDAAGIRPPEHADRPRRGDLSVPTAGQTAQAFGMFVDAVREGRLRHLDEGPLNLAVAAPGTRPLAGGTAWQRKSGAAPLVGATLAVWGYNMRSHLAAGADYDLLASIY